MLPVTQADMWKSLGIDSSHGSRLADAMVKENLITRKKLGKGFLLERLCEDKSKDKKIDLSVLLSSNNRFSPCGGCTLVCDAATCTLLSEWLLE